MKVLIFSGGFRRKIGDIERVSGVFWDIQAEKWAGGGRPCSGEGGPSGDVADNTGYFPVFVGPAGGFPGEFEALMFPDISGLSRDITGYSAGFFEGGR